MGTGFKDSISFTAGEKTAHVKHLSAIIGAARKYLEDIWKDHNAFYDKNKVSRYYGDRNKAYDTPAQRIAELRQAGVSERLEPELRPTSCIGLTLGSLKNGFGAAGDPDLSSAWEKIAAYVKANDQDGLALINALQKLDWRIWYWNPDPSMNAAWDIEDGERPSRGWHAERYRTVMKSNNYYFNRVDDKSLLVGFKTAIPKQFLEIPYFVGVAHTGYHVFPGFQGEIIEAHSMRRLDSRDNLEKSQFNPLKLGCGPRWTASEKYRSGVVCLPP